MRPIIGQVDSEPPLRVFYSSLPRVSDGKRWLSHDSRRRWCETVPAIGEDIDNHFYHWLYS